ncbi:MAG: HIT family hydrolase [Verrucomicrobia bacterium]|nr:MAG: HIT family hydrolase [Verrucomicrobiota bacterium]
MPKREMEALWCPWRVEYFEREKPDANFLSEAARTSDDAAHFVITRRKNAFLMMNRYPYAVGHLMAVPYRKTADLAALGENEIVELWNLVTHAHDTNFMPILAGTRTLSEGLRGLYDKLIDAQAKIDMAKGARA